MTRISPLGWVLFLKEKVEETGRQRCCNTAVPKSFSSGIPKTRNFKHYGKENSHAYMQWVRCGPAAARLTLLFLEPHTLAASRMPANLSAQGAGLPAAAFLLTEQLSYFPAAC